MMPRNPLHLLAPAAAAGLVLLPSMFAATCDLPMFAGARLFSTAGNSQAMVTADLNNDGFPDLVVTSSVAVSVLLGIGDGTVLIARNYLFRNPTSVAVAGFNGD